MLKLNSTGMYVVITAYVMGKNLHDSISCQKTHSEERHRTSSRLRVVA